MRGRAQEVREDKREENQRRRKLGGQDQSRR